MRSKTYYTVRSLARLGVLLAEVALVIGLIYAVVLGCGAWDALINN